jgi:hypothetical protein
MSYLDIAKKAQAKLKQEQKDSPAPLLDASEGRIIAVQICSNVLEAHIWLAFDDEFRPDDGLAVFYPDDLPFLKDKDVQTLKWIHEAKLKVGGRVRQ